MQEGLAFLAENVESIDPAGEPRFGTPSGIYGLETLPLRLPLSVPSDPPVEPLALRFSPARQSALMSGKLSRVRGFPEISAWRELISGFSPRR